MAKKRKISLQEFLERFGTEEKCREYLFQMRWPQGFVCPKCGCTHAYTMSNGRYQCTNCRYQASVTAGTIMHRTHAPLTKWFMAMYLVSNDKRGISALQLQHQISVTYKTAWYMLSRIRKAMENRDDTHQLDGVIEFDDAFFGGPTVGKKRGRGTEKAKVFVALSLDNKGSPLYLKMKTTKDIKQKSVKEFAVKHIAKGSTIKSDGYRSFGPALTGFVHEPVKYTPKGEALHWLHIMISNAKAFILGTYHGLPQKNLSSYLAEFCFRFSRRNFSSLFDRLIISMMAVTVAD